ncbi:MAG: amidohydrolase [Firmicutes bacterium]|nr:amidohydrolase [Bacillota bacterium]
MKIIDAHIHFSDIQSFKNTANNISYVDYSTEGFKTECKENNVKLGIGMGVTENTKGGFPDFSAPNPMTNNLEKKKPKKLAHCIGINPVKLKGYDRIKELNNIENSLKDNEVVGIKIYAGYYPYYVYDTVYDPIYKLAEKYKIPVVIHGGDTYSERARLKFSHPLSVDEVAVRYKKVDFIICHFGDPAITNAAGVVAKNSNVYSDLSGLIVGDENKVNKRINQRLFIEHIKRGIVYVDDYSKFLYGSDWPLVKMKPYINFIKEIIPKEYHEDVFYRNALKVFKRLKYYI